MASEFKPLITIVTPTYNQADFLEETIQSVLNQTYPNIEYIVINDGSTDHTREILDKYRDRVQCISQKNMGQSSALNTGWSLANGRYIGYLSSDDVLYENAIQLLVTGIEDGFKDGFGIVYGDYDIISESGDRIKKHKSESFDRKRLQVDLVCQPGLMPIFSKKIFDLIGGWDESLKQVPDFEYWLRCSSVCSFRKLNVSVGGYRVHIKSTSYKVMDEERAEEICKVVNAFFGGGDGSMRLSGHNVVRSKANGLILASKNHAMSRRYIKAIDFLFEAVRLDKSIIFNLITWRIVISGFLRGIKVHV